MALTKRQQEVRAYSIGSSEIAVLCNLSRWSTPIAIYERFMGLSKEATLQMDLGVELEEPVARVWAKRKARFLLRVDSLKNPEMPAAAATPDRAVFLAKPPGRSDRKLKREELQDGVERLLEVKTTNWRQRRYWGDEGTDFVPEDYLAQAQWQMGVSGVHRLDFAVLFDRDELLTYHLNFSPPMFAGMYEIAERFLIDYVATQTPPPPDASERYGEFLSRQYPGRFYEKKEPLDLLTASAELEETVLRYAQLKVVETRVERHLKLCANQIKLAIGAAAGLSSPRFGKLTWKRTKDGEKFDAESAFTELSAMIALVVQGMPEGDQRTQLTQQMQAIAARHTVPKAGHRTLRSSWDGDAKKAADTLASKLGSLEIAHIEKSAVSNDEEEKAEAEADAQEPL